MASKAAAAAVEGSPCTLEQFTHFDEEASEVTCLSAERCHFVTPCCILVALRTWKTLSARFTSSFDFDAFTCSCISFKGGGHQFLVIKTYTQHSIILLPQVSLFARVLIVNLTNAAGADWPTLKGFKSSDEHDGEDGTPTAY